MPETTIAPGLTISHPETVAASATTPARKTARGTTRRAGSRGAGASNPATDLSPLVAALGQQGFQLVGQFELQPKATRGSGPSGRRGRSGAPGGAAAPSSVQLELAADEDAVLLTIDDNDEVDWVLPGGASVTEGSTRRARGRAATSRPRSGKRTVTFDVGTTTTVRKPGAGGRRAGVLSKVATGVAGNPCRARRSAMAVPPVIDAIGYSRGGLVLRTLLERVIPGTPWEGRFNQALFVGSTLNGTKLAQEKNWKAFVKIYTNIAIAACRGVAIVVPPAAVASVWVGTVARGVSVLVRFLATATLDKGGVPGLASMDPDQAIVKAMNRTAPPSTLSATYRAITNDYEPGAADSDGIPASFRNKLADLIMDAQMNEPNDLVVNQSSMSFVCGALPAAQVLVLPTNGRTIHTTYFRDPAVIAQLRTWLLGSGASPAAGAPGRARSTGSSRPQAGRRKTLRRRG